MLSGFRAKILVYDACYVPQTDGERQNELAIESFWRFFRGERPSNLLNPEILDR